MNSTNSPRSTTTNNSVLVNEVAQNNNSSNTSIPYEMLGGCLISFSLFNQVLVEIKLKKLKNSYTDSIFLLITIGC